MEIMKKRSGDSPLLFLLSYLDSNQDKLIQSQMCYRYTIGHYLVFRCFFLSKAGAKVHTFFYMAKLFFIWESEIGN